MLYQLVLQFRSDSLEDLDAIVELEDSLIEQLGQAAEVDGHDIGFGEINVFLYTSNPADTFASIQPILARASLLSGATVAYRRTDATEWTVVWPQHSGNTFNVA